MDPRLHQAVRQGNVQKLKELTEKDPKLLQSKTPHDNTVLHIAAKLGHADFVKEVIYRDNTLLVTANKDGDTPLHIAARTTHTNVASLLIELAKNWPPEIESTEKPLRMINNQLNTALHEAVNTALHEAVRTWPLKMVYEFLSKEKMVHEFNNKKKEMIHELLEADSGVTSMLNKKQETPLHIAAHEGLSEIVDEILKYDPVVKSTEPTEPKKLDTGTPLHQAVLGGHIKIVEKLLYIKPNLIEKDDNKGNTVLHSAAQKNDAKIVDLLLSKNLMLAYQKNKKGKSPLLVAAAYGSNAAIKEILKHCPDAEEQADDGGRNALHIAVNNRTVGSLKFLLTNIKSVDIINKPDKDGNTPLHLAAQKSLLQSMHLLLKDKRVKPYLVNNNGQTARILLELLEGGMDTYEMYIWKKLKERETKTISKQQFPEATKSRAFRRLVTPSDKQFESTKTIYTLVASLIATVTFAATFTVPGGYGQTDGKALLTYHAAFKVFIISNTIAMCSSIVVIFCFFWAWNDPDPYKLQVLTLGNRLIAVAFLGMMVALATAVFVTISEDCKWLAIVVILICCSAPFIVLANLNKDVLFIPIPP